MKTVPPNIYSETKPGFSIDDTLCKSTLQSSI